jgi:hypothetical protein
MNDALWWQREKHALVDDIAIALTRFSMRLRREAKKVIVHKDEYNGESVDGLELETTRQRANRGKVVVL